MDETVGVKVSVTLESGEKLRGWLYDEDRRDLYVSLDSKGKVIVHIPRREVKNVNYDHQANRASFEGEPSAGAAKEAEHFDREVFEEVTEILTRVDFNRVRRIALRLRSKRDQLQYFERQTVDHPSPFVLPPDLVLDLTDTYAALLDEIERSGLESIIVQYDGRIRSFVSTDTLPWVDGEVAEQDEIRTIVQLAREKYQIVETDSGRKLLKEITPEKVVDAEKAEDRTLRSRLRVSSPDQPKKLRKVAALGKIALGGTLAAANVSLGITAGVVSALPTLGLGTVGAAAGIVTSTYTGLNAACDGLKDYASILEDAKT